MRRTHHLELTRDAHESSAMATRLAILKYQYPLSRGHVLGRQKRCGQAKTWPRGNIVISSRTARRVAMALGRVVHGVVCHPASRL